MAVEPNALVVGRLPEVRWRRLPRGAQPAPGALAAALGDCTWLFGDGECAAACDAEGRLTPAAAAGGDSVVAAALLAALSERLVAVLARLRPDCEPRREGAWTLLRGCGDLALRFGWTWAPDSGALTVRTTVRRLAGHAAATWPPAMDGAGELGWRPAGPFTAAVLPCGAPPAVAPPAPAVQADPSPSPSPPPGTPLEPPLPAVASPEGEEASDDGVSPDEWPATPPFRPPSRKRPRPESFPCPESFAPLAWMADPPRRFAPTTVHDESADDEKEAKVDEEQEPDEATKPCKPSEATKPDPATRVADPQVIASALRSVKAAAAQVLNQPVETPAVDAVAADPPSLLVGASRALAAVPAGLLPSWELAQLRPFSDAKDVDTALLVPDDDRLAALAAQYVREVRALYTACGLGRQEEPEVVRVPQEADAAQAFGEAARALAEPMAAPLVVYVAAPERGAAVAAAVRAAAPAEHAAVHVLDAAALLRGDARAAAFAVYRQVRRVVVPDGAGGLPLHEPAFVLQPRRPGAPASAAQRSPTPQLVSLAEDDDDDGDLAAKAAAQALAEAEEGGNAEAAADSATMHAVLLGGDTKVANRARELAKAHLSASPGCVCCGEPAAGVHALPVLHCAYAARGARLVSAWSDERGDLLHTFSEPLGDLEPLWAQAERLSALLVRVARPDAPRVASRLVFARVNGDSQGQGLPPERQLLELAAARPIKQMACVVLCDVAEDRDAQFAGTAGARPWLVCEGAVGRAGALSDDRLLRVEVRAHHCGSGAGVPVRGPVQPLLWRLLWALHDLSYLTVEPAGGVREGGVLPVHVWSVLGP